MNSIPTGSVLTTISLGFGSLSRRNYELAGTVILGRLERQGRVPYRKKQRRLIIACTVGTVCKWKR